MPQDWERQHHRSLRADRRNLTSTITGTHMFELIALIGLIAIGAYGIRRSTDTPLDRVHQSLWPYLHH